MDAVLQRLGFLVDTSGLLRGQAAMDTAAASGVRLGQSADQASVKLSNIGRTGPASLKPVADEMDRIAVAGRGMGDTCERVSTKMTMLGTAAGTVAGIFAFQLLASITSVVTELASIPIASAKAQDALTKFNAQLMFAFKGSSDSVKQARNDIIQLAREAGVPLAQLRGDYADIAISGRSAGLTRTQVSGAVGAFAQLGQLSGADPGQLSRSMYQYQQMLNVGQVRWADFKLADLNLPAFGDAVAAGMGTDSKGVSSAELVGKISRGELSAYQLTEALAKGVPKLLEQAGGELPKTMSRAQAAMESEWTRLMENMGTAWKTSEFIQSLQYGIGHFLRVANEGNETPQQELARLRRGNSSISDFGQANRGLDGVPAGRARDTARIAVLEKQIADEAAAAARALSAEEKQARDARHMNAFGVVTNLDPIMAAQAQGRADIDTVNKALADTTGLAADKVAELRRGLALLEGQLSRIESATDRARRQSREGAADLIKYGPGAGYDISQSARGLFEQAKQQMRPITMEQAMQIVRDQRQTGIMESLAGQAGDLSLQRDLLAPSFGGTAAARRNAQMRYAEASYVRGHFDNADSEDARKAAAVFRKNQGDEADLSDIKTLAERRSADEESLRTMRERQKLGLQVGLQGKIAVAQLEKEQGMRRAVTSYTAEQLQAEKDRTAEIVTINDELEQQARHYSLIVDSANVAAGTIGRAFSAALSEGIQTGTVRGITILDVFADSASRIINNVIADVLSPVERGITDFFTSFASKIGGSLGSSSTIGFTPVNTASAALSAPVIPHYASGTSFHPGGMAWVGEQGPELVNLPRGSGVIPNHNLPNGGGGVQINVIDQRSGGAPVETQESRGPDGMRQIEVLIRDQQDSNLRSGKMDGAMKAQYGAARQIKTL